MNKPRGFTLIELLVVIAIISVLASILVVGVSSVRSKARDAKRKNDLRTISIAVQIYLVDNNSLPRSTGWCTYISNPDNGWGSSFQQDISSSLATVPLDPVLANQVGDYFYYNQGDTEGKFVLCATLENSTGQAYDYRYCAGGSIYNYCISF